MTIHHLSSEELNNLTLKSIISNHSPPGINQKVNSLRSFRTSDIKKDRIKQTVAQLLNCLQHNRI